MAAARTIPARRRDQKLRSVELFAGAGGLAVGLDRAGFKPALVVDADEHSFATLTANKHRYTRGWKIQQADVRELRYEELGLKDLALVSAGAPCQPFSVGGRLRGEDDDRNMFPEVVRAVRELRTRAFVFENVRGLLFERVRPYFDYILDQLRVPSRSRGKGESWRTHQRVLRGIPEEAHEFRVGWHLLNAADFGLAQNRPRLVVVGMRVGEKPFTWPEPTHSRRKLIEALRGDDYWEEYEVPARLREEVRAQLPTAVQDDGAAAKRWLTLRDLTARLGPPHDKKGSDLAHRLVPGARLYRKHTGSRLDWPAKTIKAGVHGCPGGEHILVADDGSHRYLTVRECAELQGFPDDYLLPEKRRPAMRQLGNAVPMTLAEAIGRCIRVALDDEYV